MGDLKTLGEATASGLVSGAMVEAECRDGGSSSTGIHRCDKSRKSGRVKTEADENNGHPPAEDEGLLWLAELGPEVGGGSVCVVVTKLPGGALEMAR